MPSLVLIAVFGGIGLASFAFVMQGYQARKMVRKERKARQEAEAKAALYETHLTNILGERRAAEVVVEEQTTDQDGRLWTKLKFMEYGADGNPMEPKVFTVPGSEVYFDALGMQFTAEQVKAGKTKSLYLFRRVFTDETRPDMGARIFEVDDDVPGNYESAEVPADTQRQVWARFQRWIADEEYAKSQGVRTIFGQATYRALRKGRMYRLTIQDNGGLIIEDQPLPKILREGEGQ